MYQEYNALTTAELKRNKYFIELIMKERASHDEIERPQGLELVDVELDDYLTTIWHINEKTIEIEYHKEDEFAVKYDGIYLTDNRYCNGDGNNIEVDEENIKLWKQFMGEFGKTLNFRSVMNVFAILIDSKYGDTDDDDFMVNLNIEKIYERVDRYYDAFVDFNGRFTDEAYKRFDLYLDSKED